MNAADPDVSDVALRRRLSALSAGAAEICFRCDECGATCPRDLFGDDGLDVCRLLREAGAAGRSAADDEPLWRCTTCGACDAACPEDAAVSEVLLALRTLSAEAGRGPRPRDRVLRDVWLTGNPDGAAPGAREELDAASPLPPIAAGDPCLLYLGSPIAHDPRLRRIATAMGDVLAAAAVQFGVLDHEPESGDAHRLLGERRSFEKAASAAVAELVGLGAREVVTLSPHDHDVFKRFYPQFGWLLRVFDATEYLAQLVRYDLLAFAGEREVRALYHDPCYLGRRHGVYDPPRRLLRALPGLELGEFAQCREDAVCCGAGGGRIWMDPEAADEFARRRVTEARERGADYLVTACPNCIRMFESALEREGLATPVVSHVVELAAAWGPYVPLSRRALQDAPD